MTISNITNVLEKLAPLYLQEDYDNAGLMVGEKSTICTGVLICLDATEEVIQEAVQKNCNLVIAHHPILFKGLKKINQRNYAHRSIIAAIKNNIAIYACHTNLDNIIQGVNGKIADLLGLTNRRILLPKPNVLSKLNVFIPPAYEQKVLDALFLAGAGHIGNYSECSFVSDGMGSFKPGENAHPVVGQIGSRSTELEKRAELIFPNWLEGDLIQALKQSHPYEEVAYEIIPIKNNHQQIGSGIIGELLEEMNEKEFLLELKKKFNINTIKHTAFRNKSIKKVAICGGSGSFLTIPAIAQQSDILITSDIKYHEFFDADHQILLADIGHYESEQFTIELIADVLTQNFPNFAILKTGINTNPVQYLM